MATGSIRPFCAHVANYLAGCKQPSLYGMCCQPLPGSLSTEERHLCLKSSVFLLLCSLRGFMISIVWFDVIPNMPQSEHSKPDLTRKVVHPSAQICLPFCEPLVVLVSEISCRNRHQSYNAGPQGSQFHLRSRPCHLAVVLNWVCHDVGHRSNLR